MAGRRNRHLSGVGIGDGAIIGAVRGYATANSGRRYRPAIGHALVRFHMPTRLRCFASGNPISNRYGDVASPTPPKWMVEADFRTANHFPIIVSLLGLSGSERHGAVTRGED